MIYGTLYLVPVPLGPVAVASTLATPVQQCAKQLKHFIAENAKSARAFLKAYPPILPYRKSRFVS